MANSIRRDNPEFIDHRTGQQPIVLARLPRVGAALPQPAPDIPPAVQAVPPPEVMPQLDLRTEIDQRIRLHVADTADAPTDQAPATSHFADREHVADRGPRVRPPASVASDLPLAEQQPSLSKPQVATVSEPTSFSERVFQLHAQLSPHAGLIVALALIASAGLLYWMIVGPARAPMPPGFENNSDIYSFDLRDEGLESPPNYMPEFTVDLPEPTNPQPVEPVSSSADQWTKVLEMPRQPTPPEENPPPLKELPPADESSYPTTKNANALDFTILKHPAANSPQSPSEVARRPTAPTNR